MLLRRSRFVHLLDLPSGIVLALHAVRHLRVTVTPQVAGLIRGFDQPRTLEAAIPALCRELGAEEAAIRGCVALLIDQGILTDQDEAAETGALAAELDTTHGRDPTELLDRYRRARMQGAHPYWAVEAPRGLSEAHAFRQQADLLVLGDCDVQMETDFLRQEAAGRGIDLRVAASFAADTALAGERAHDAILIGALQARHAVVLGDPEHHGGDPARVYVGAVETMLTKLRGLSAAPILIDGLPEPTVQPLGFADRGAHSHRNRFRRTNLALAELADTFPDVHLVDTAAALAAAGSAALLDDGLMGFTHFGAPGWLLQRPESELAAVHHQFPDRQPLADLVGGDPYGRERVMARAHVDTLATILGWERKKCVIVDLDGVLWPGVLAETGSPFAWAPEIGGPNSYAGLYFGIHEALLSLRRRGILLACVSKNDEETVRSLWRYGPDYPAHRLLSPAHFVTMRINWRDKAANIRSIADELGFALDTFVFIDDTARERERVRESLPEVTVLGENLFALRRILLTDPRLQTTRITAEAAQRSTLVQAQLDRARLRAESADEAAFLGSLAVETTVERLTPSSADEVRQRVRELIARTTQFNATGMVFAEEALRRIIAEPDGRVFILRMRDRLADHGLVGVAVVRGGAILNFVMSCRVIGLGGESALLAAVTLDAGGGVPSERTGGSTAFEALPSGLEEAGYLGLARLLWAKAVDVGPPATMTGGRLDDDGSATVARGPGVGRLIVGRIVPTGRNPPVRRLYADDGFTDAGDGWWVKPAPGLEVAIVGAAHV